MRKLYFLVTILMLALVLAGCQPQPEAAPPTNTNMTNTNQTLESIDGDWQGKLNLPGGLTFDLVVHFRQDGDQISGTIDIPNQGVSGLELYDIQANGNLVGFKMHSGSLPPASFEGEMQDGKIVGEYQQSKFKGEYELQRVDALAEAEPATPEPEEPLPYREEEVKIQNGDITLAGTLTLPETGEPHPAVIMISGSGPQDRDNSHPSMPEYKPFRWIADHLTRAGVAVLRYDDRAVGESVGGKRNADTSFDFATDVEAVLEYLLSRPDINPDQVGALGHSEGSWIAAIVAARNPKVAFIVSMGGHAVRGSEVIMHQMELVTPEDGLSEEEIRRQTESNRKEMELITNQDWDALEEFFYEETLKIYREDPQIPESELEQTAREAARRQLEGAKGWFYPFVTENPADYWQEVRVPVLALWGEKDDSVDPEQNAAPMEAALKRAGNQDYSIVVFPNATHLFLDYVSDEMALAPGVLETITHWITDRTLSQNE